MWIDIVWDEFCMDIWSPFGSEISHSRRSGTSSWPSESSNFGCYYDRPWALSTPLHGFGWPMARGRLRPNVLGFKNRSAPYDSYPDYHFIFSWKVRPKAISLPNRWSSGFLCPGEADGCGPWPCAVQTHADPRQMGTLGIAGVSCACGHGNPFQTKTRFSCFAFKCSMGVRRNLWKGPKKEKPDGGLNP